MNEDSLQRWPAIHYADWADTCAALLLWTQIVGKFRLANAPWLNHSWHATLYPSARGLTTGLVPIAGMQVAIELDFAAHRLVAASASGACAGFPLGPMSVAEFLDRTRHAVEALGVPFKIHGVPNELPEVVPFVDDVGPRPYDADAVARYHRALLSIDAVFNRFRTGWLGKCSPVHLFWGGFDLAVTRFSGRPAPPHPGGVPHLPDVVTREAYSHEVSSAGFWPGGAGADEASFYAYAYPTPAAFGACAVEPDAAHWDDALGEFLLPYAAVRASDDPEAELMAFLQSTYAAAADTGAWARDALECPIGRPGVPRPLGTL